MLSKYHAFVALSGIVLIGCSIANIEKSDNQQNGWSAREISGTPFSMDLPENATIEERTWETLDGQPFDIVAIRSGEDPDSKGFFEFHLRYLSEFESADDYLDSICKGVTEWFDTKGDFSGSKIRFDKTVNDIRVVDFYPKCHFGGYIPIMVIDYSGKIYEIRIIDNGNSVDGFAMEKAVLSIRPAE